MWIKLLILGMFLGIIVSLGSALYFMVNDKAESNNTVKALSWRIGISVGLFAVIMILSFTGIIKPHGIAPQMPPGATTQSINK